MSTSKVRTRSPADVVAYAKMLQQEVRDLHRGLTGQEKVTLGPEALKAVHPPAFTKSKRYLLLVTL